MLHYSVLLKETIEGLNIKSDGVYVDCTLGYAGHSMEILKKITRGCLFAFDQDINAINYSREKLKTISNNFLIIKSNFKSLKIELLKQDIFQVDGILFDLGVSSPQLDNADRGFSYHYDAPLDMRMDLDAKTTAYDVVNSYSYQDLKRIITTYGDEKYASSIAKNIEKARQVKEIATTLELVEIIKRSMPEAAKRDKHPAKKTFQAIRIEVNHELEILENSLRDAISLLKPEGRLCVISFHSLEDKICSKVFKELSRVPNELRNLPSIPAKYKPSIKIIKKIKPSKEELTENNRSRSAVLRIIEKI